MPCTPQLGLGWGTVAAAVTELCGPAPTRALERLGPVGQAAVITFSPKALVTLTPSESSPPACNVPVLPAGAAAPPPRRCMSTLSCPPFWAFPGVTSLHLGASAGVREEGCSHRSPPCPGTASMQPRPGVCPDAQPAQPPASGLAPSRGPELERVLPRSTRAAAAGGLFREAPLTCRWG